jgi:hypothetical protein
VTDDLDLDTLSTEELRHRAFTLAESRRDVRFFWDLVRHLPLSADVATEDGSSGNISGSIAETVEIVREVIGKDTDYGDVEPLLRAHFIDYLQSHG